MPARIAENDLFLPALYVIYRNRKANTAKIKETLLEVFQPTGEDAEILAGRKDTKFSQKVRNLMGSHYPTNGMAQHAVKDANHYFSLTPVGQKAVEDNLEYLTYLFDNGFPYEQATTFAAKVHAVQKLKRTIYIYDETVQEGALETRPTAIRERSRKLRDAAVQAYTVDGTIRCAACGFDFSRVYGEHGAGYIQIHHENPVYQYSDEGFTAYIPEAVKAMKPLCANCHCMIHRNRAHMLTIAQLQEILRHSNGE